MCEVGWLYNPIKPFQAMAAGSLTPAAEKEKKEAENQTLLQAITTPKTSETIAAPKTTDASVQTAGDTERKRAAALAAQTVKTTSRGLGDMPLLKKKKLLGE